VTAPCAVCGFPRWRGQHAEWCERVRAWLAAEDAALKEAQRARGRNAVHFSHMARRERHRA
jgi:hypothetical protein